MTEQTLAVLALALGILGAKPAHADVNVGISIGTPAPPPVVVTAPPPVILVPGTTVYRMPSAEFNVFVHNGRYYSFHNGAWFIATRWGAPWTAVAVERVPRPVLAVPVTYYRIPPGHARKMGAPAGVIVDSPGKGPRHGKPRD
jgi:hypothetical protein